MKQCVASLKSVKATLETFAAQTNDPEMEREFREAEMSFAQMIAELNQRVSELEREEPQYKGF